jgi:hypothetical protein
VILGFVQHRQQYLFSGGRQLGERCFSLANIVRSQRDELKGSICDFLVERGIRKQVTHCSWEHVWFWFVHLFRSAHTKSKKLSASSNTERSEEVLKTTLG